eukprot:6190135-Pleurochrysis_carterae.AAC.2
MVSRRRRGDVAVRSSCRARGRRGGGGLWKIHRNAESCVAGRIQSESFCARPRIVPAELTGKKPEPGNHRMLCLLLAESAEPKPKREQLNEQRKGRQIASKEERPVDVTGVRGSARARTASHARSERESHMRSTWCLSSGSCARRQRSSLISSSDWSKKSLEFLMILMQTISPVCKSRHWIALLKAAEPKYSFTQYLRKSRGRVEASALGDRCRYDKSPFTDGEVERRRNGKSLMLC